MENLQTPIPDKRHCCTTSPVARSEYKTFLQHWSTKETCFFTTCASRQQQPRTVRIKKKNWNYIFYIFLIIIIITSSLERTSLEKKIRREIMTKYIRIKTLQMNGSNFKMRVFKKKDLSSMSKTIYEITLKDLHTATGNHWFFTHQFSSSKSFCCL